MSIPNQPLVHPPDFATAIEMARRFTLGRPGVGPGIPVVVAGGWERSRTDYRMIRSGTEVLAVEFVLEGTGHLTLGARRARLGPGLVFTYGPGVPHRIVPGSGVQLSKYFLNLDGRVAAEALAAHHLAPGAIRRLRDPGPVAGLLDLLIGAGQQGGPGAGSITGHLTLALLGMIAEDSMAEGALGLGSYATWQRLCLVMEEHHPRIATVEGIAALVGISPIHCCRLFAQHGHETALQHLTRLRMRRAARLLEAGQSAKDVAADLGFADQFHFSRSFRRVWGASPRAWLALAARREERMESPP